MLGEVECFFFSGELFFSFECAVSLRWMLVVEEVA